MTSSTEKQIFTVHILPNISRKKGNQAMKMRNTFLTKLCKNCGREMP